MTYWPGMSPAAAEGQGPANVGMWDKFSGWIGQPENQLLLANLGKGIAGPDSFAAQLTDAMAPTMKGQVARRYGEAKKQEQMKWSELLAQPHVGGVSEATKPDGSTSISIKATPQSDLAKAEIIRAQQQAGQVQPIAPTPQAQLQASPPTQAGYGFRGASEAQAGTNAASGGRFSDAFANPSTSPSSASGLGLNPEELLATEAGAREYVAQPVTNAYNIRLSDQLALSTEMKRKQGLLPVTIPSATGAEPRTMWLTPEQMIQYEDMLRKDERSREYHQLIAGQRADQLQAMEPVRQAQALANQTLGEERQQKVAQQKAIEEMLQARGDKKVPGTDYTYREAHRLGILDNLEANAQALRIQEQKEAQRKEELALEGHRKMIAEMSDPYNPKSMPKAKAAADAWLKQMYPDVAKKYLGAAQPGEKVSVIPPGSSPVPGKVGPNGRKVWRTPDGKLFEED